jgi:hypothetical protein
MRFVTLFTARVRHDYYPDGVCRDVSVEPTAPTRRLIDRYRLRIGELPDGIVVCTPTSPDGKTSLLSVKRNEVFAFHLRVRNPDFPLFTDLQELVGKSDPVYTNAGLPTGGRALKLIDRKAWSTETVVVPAGSSKIKFTLGGNPLADSGDVHKLPRPADFSIATPTGNAKIAAYDAAAKTVTIDAISGIAPDLFSAAGQTVSVRYRTRPVPDRGVLADVELQYDKSMPAAGSAVAPFEITFKAKAGRWAYYVLTDALGGFAIVDTTAPGPPVVFSAANRVLLNQVPDEPDALAVALSRQCPGLQRFRFLSDQPIRCSSAARKGIELRLGGEKVLETIPNPPVRQLCRINQEEAFYQVVKYVRAN